MKTLIFSLICFLSLSLTGQVQISGAILDSKTGKGVEAVNVFIPYSNIGTMTDAEGKFSMTVPVGKSELVASHIAYKTVIRKLSYIEPGEKSQTIRMSANTVKLEEVTVSAKSGKKWRKNLKKFEKAFFGASENAAFCKILNPTVLNIENESGKLIATASDLIEIENRGTGYKMLFLLEKFEADGPEVSYAGKPFFKELDPLDGKETVLWEKRRKKTFLGSTTHFYQALLYNRLEEEGFDLYKATLQKNKEFLISGQPDLHKLIKKGSNPSEVFLDFEGFLQVVYTKERDEISIKSTSLGTAAKRMGHAAEQELIAQEKNIKNFKSNQVSYLFARKAKVPLDNKGYLLRPELIVEYGYWNLERVADLLPKDYLQLKPNLVHKSAEDLKSDEIYHPPILGFEMKKLRIPYTEIKRGGPPKDGIPSIDNPKFVTTKSSNIPKDEDMVLGMVIGDRAKAYPIDILDKHEIVNDWFGKEPVAVTYCPLCGSGAAFNARLDGKRRNFGVSGLLYNSDVLLYDRETESLWSQIMGEAVSGKASGTKLEMIPIVQTTWKDWREAHPATMVLSTDTGFNRDYSRKSYISYRNSDKLMFPVSEESNQFKNKETVIGIEVDGNFKAYPFSKLAETEEILEDLFNGKKLRIEFDRKNQSARIYNESNELLPAITLYWFAWYAFHPETEVFD